LEALGHERRQFVTIGTNVVQDLLDGGAKLRKGGVVAVASNLPFQELPEPLDWLFILHLDCVAKRNDCTLSAKRIMRWL